VEVLANLRERDYGAVEGLTPAEVAARYPALAPTGVITGWDATPAGGETPREVLARVSQVLANLRAAHAGQAVLVCAHAFVLRTLHYLLDELPEPQFFTAQGLGNGEFIVRQLREPVAH
jgi:broad specificity phosphatase PhoE